MKATGIQSYRPFLALIIIILIVYVALKASFLSFTHDESMTFKMLIGESGVEKTANNHLLNTYLVRVVYFLGGHSEFLLRLPNVIAFIFYAVFLYKISTQWLRFVPSLLCFSILIFNPYLLDYFSLSRGYGLALCCELCCCYFLLKFSHILSAKDFLINAAIVLSLSLMASFANFICLNLNIAVLIMCVIEFLLIIKRNNYLFELRHKITLAFIVAINFLAILFLLSKVLILKEANELYYGGHKNFIDDSVTGLIQHSFYMSFYSEEFRNFVLQGLLITFLSGILYSFIKSYYSAFSRITVLLVLMVYSAVLQHYLFNTLYPLDRTSLIYIPLYGLFISFFLEEIANGFNTYARTFAFTLVLLLVCIPLCVHLIQNLNLKYAIDFKYDSNTKTAMKEIERLHKGELRNKKNLLISNDWVFEPIINYYRNLYSMDYLEPANRNGINPKSDFIYYSIDSFPKEGHFKVIKEFEVSKTKLLQKVE